MIHSQFFHILQVKKINFMVGFDFDLLFVTVMIKMFACFCYHVCFFFQLSLHTLSLVRHTTVYWYLPVPYVHLHGPAWDWSVYSSAVAVLHLWESLGNYEACASARALLSKPKQPGMA